MKLGENIPIRKELKEIFGIENFKHGLFYDFQCAIRFDLNDGGSHLKMFLQSWDRFNEIFNFIFKNSKSLDIVLCTYDDKNIKKEHPKGFCMLKKCGFKLPEKLQSFKTIYKEDDDEVNASYQYLYYFTSKKDIFNVKSIIWVILGGELGIRPTAGVSAYFIDFNREILVHPYDDRGCDIIGVEKKTLLPIYTKYKQWLIDYDYDREKMKKFFEEGE